MTTREEYIERKLKGFATAIDGLETGLANIKDKLKEYEASGDKAKEPEFKVGDWVISDGRIKDWVDRPVQIVGTDKNDYDEIVFKLSSGCSYHPSNLQKTTAPEPEVNWNVRPKFEVGDTCWKVTWDGGVIQKPFAKYYLNFDLYRTRTEAEWYAEQQKLIIEMEDFIGFDDLDWNDIGQTKYFFAWSIQFNKWRPTWDNVIQLAGLFPPCPTEKIADKTLLKFKDRLDYLKPYDGRNEP